MELSYHSETSAGIDPAEVLPFIRESFGETEACDPIHDAFNTHFTRTGKLMRSRICLNTAVALGLSRTDSLSLASCVESLHNASLVQDDFQDQDLQRRNAPTISAQYGSNIAIGLTNRLISTSFVCLQRGNLSESLGSLMQQIHEAINTTVLGQTLDLEKADACSSDDLLSIAKKKSGPLFALALELPLLAGGFLQALPQAHDSACHFGLGYQILDDLWDFNKDTLKDSDSNIINALTDKQDVSQSIRHAKELAETELRSSIELATPLPHGSGEELKSMSVNMLEQLKHCHD